MRKKTFLWIASALIIFAGCTDKELETPTPEAGAGKLVLTASVPTESSQTRVSITPDLDSKNIIVTWKEYDMFQFYFKQGATLYPPTSIQLAPEDITNGGKSANFTIDVPQGIDHQAPYTVYAIHGSNSRFDANGDVIVNISPVGFKAFYQLDNIPIIGQVEVAAGASIGIINFEHLGMLQCLYMFNGSAEGFTCIPSLGPASSSGTDWYYTASYGIVPYYNLRTESVQNENEQLPPPQFPEFGEITIPQYSLGQLFQWVMPKSNPAPEIVLNAQPPMGAPPIVSVNSKPARTTAMQIGKAYYLYALWDGTSLYFTDDTFTPSVVPLAGNLMHADGGDDYIGVVYSKNDGNVYYNSTQNGSTWLGETLLGAGSEARMAIDRIAGNYKPHVVFRTSDNKIAYTKFDGTNWSAPVYIETNNAGICYWPDIDVDVNGYAHITYTDTQGENGAYTDQPDIMYAENITNGDGTFKKVVIYNGYVNNMGGSDWSRCFYNKGSRIAVDEIGNYYIMAHEHIHNTYGYQDRYYGVVVTTSTSSGGTAQTQVDNYDIYDIVGYGGSIYALYKDDDVIRTGSIALDGTITSQPYDALNNQAINPHGLSPRLEVAGLYGTNLFVKYNDAGIGYEEAYSDITVKQNTRVAVVNKGNEFSVAYILYTDDADSNIKVMTVPTRPPS